MLYYLADILKDGWGPFRLLQSHALLLAGGTVLAALLTLLLLPKFFEFLPQDHGKAILGKDGMKSKGKPTGGGFFVTLLALPVILLVMPLRLPDLGVIACLYLSMLFGYLDDRSTLPWGELKKGLLDIIVSVGAATCIYWGYAQGTGIPDGLLAHRGLCFFHVASPLISPQNFGKKNTGTNAGQTGEPFKKEETTALDIPHIKYSISRSLLLYFALLYRKV